MKKSEVIEAVYEYLIHNKDVSNLSKAHQIPELLINLGMLPPNDKYTNSDDNYLLEHYNKWEDEDEKK